MGGSAKPAWWSRGSRKEGQPWVRGPAADTGGKVVARDVGLNPVTGLSKRCPPSLEEQGQRKECSPKPGRAGSKRRAAVWLHLRMRSLREGKWAAAFPLEEYHMEARPKG